MDEIGNQISSLMMDTDKSAAEITHLLKTLGGSDSMQQGLTKLVEHVVNYVEKRNEQAIRRSFEKATTESHARGILEGILIGFFATSVFSGGFALVKHLKSRRKQHKVETINTAREYTNEVPSQEALELGVEVQDESIRAEEPGIEGTSSSLIN